VRYVYGVSAALLLAGSTAALINGGPIGAQETARGVSTISAVNGSVNKGASLADLVEKLQPAVVNISTRQKVKVRNNPFAGSPFGGLFGNRGRRGGDSAPQTREAQSLGSGFIISADGYVVTNNHVVAAGDRSATIEKITVIMPDRTEYEAKLVGRDAASDIAVLKISAPKPLPFVRFGDSTRARVGDQVIAIGNPFGLGGTVTAGIVSAIHRNTGQGGAYDRFLQTDASINRGNSGGPMFDASGNVIGINNAIISPTGGNVGIGFAIPAEVAVPIVNTLRKGESVERGYLGVQIEPISEDLALSLGVKKNSGEFVQRVEPGEAAAKAGVKAGDVILKVNGKNVTPDQTLSFLVANLPVGTRVPLEILRDGKRRTVTARLGKRPTEEEFANRFKPEAEEDFSDQDEKSSEQATQDVLGLAVVELTPNIARQIRVESSQKGVVVSAVDPSSDAARKGLRRGDVIVSINRKATLKTGDVNRLVNGAKNADRGAVLLEVKRRSQNARFIPVRLRDS